MYLKIKRRCKNSAATVPIFSSQHNNYIVVECCSISAVAMNLDVFPIGDAIITNQWGSPAAMTPY